MYYKLVMILRNDEIFVSISSSKRSISAASSSMEALTEAWAIIEKNKENIILHKFNFVS